MATLEIRKETNKVWRHVPSDALPYIVSKLYIKSDGDFIRVVEQGGSQRGQYNFADVSVYNIGGVAETFGSAQQLMERLEALNYIGFFYEGEVSPSELISSDVDNAIELGTDGKLFAPISGGAVDSVNGQTGTVVLDATDVSALSNDTTDYTDATTPLAGTEIALVEQGGTFKKVAVSEFGGGGSTLDITSTFPNQMDYKAISSGFTQIGAYSALSFIGTQSNASTDGGSTSLRKILSSATAGNSAIASQSSINFITINKGFWFDQRIDELDSDVATDSRCSYGLAGVALIGNIEPSAYAQGFLSLGHESTDSNFQIFHKRSGVGGLNKIDLGVNFPKNANKSFHLRFYRLPNETTINYYVKNITDDFEASGTFDFDGTPPSLTPNNWRNNNTSAVVVGFGINRILTRTEDERI